jgi:hypothetical protein
MGVPLWTPIHTSSEPLSPASLQPSVVTCATSIPEYQSLSQGDVLPLAAYLMKDP